MQKETKEALQVTKEIVVKFIETGRVSPNNISEIFPTVFDVVKTSITTSATSDTNNDETEQE